MRRDFERNLALGSISYAHVESHYNIRKFIPRTKKVRKRERKRENKFSQLSRETEESL